MGYVQRDYNLQEALDAVGPGWSSLIYEFYMARQFSEYLKVAQIKEKFAGLRIYVDHGTDRIWNIINDLEERSFKTCEMCGRPGSRRPTGWIKTLCFRHYVVRLIGDKYVRRHYVRRIKAILKRKLKHENR